MKKFFAFFVCVCFTLTANTAHAQVHLGKFADNWFIQVGGGINTIIDNGTVSPLNPAVEVNFGKWLTPHVGLAIGYNGISNRAADTSAGWFAGEDTFGYHYAHFDALWNPFKSGRFAGGPYLHAGVINTVWKEQVHTEMGLGIGLFAEVRLVRNLSIQVNVRPTFAREDAFRSSGKVLCFGDCTISAKWNFGWGADGKVGFDLHRREVEVVKVVEMMECNHAAIISKYEAKIDSLNRVPPTVEVKPIELQYVVYFPLDKSNMLERERYHLLDLIEALPKEGVSLYLVGHADKETGRAAHNKRLSERRVETVMKAVREMGFKGYLTTEAMGDTANPFAEPYPKNRCVTIKAVVTL